MKKKCLSFVLLLCMLVLQGCGNESVKEEVPELLTPVGVSMDTAVVERKDFDRKTTYIGMVEPEIKELYFEMDGILSEVAVQYGDTVKKGDVLAVLDQEKLEEQIESLERQIAHKQQVNRYTNQQLQYEITICQTELNQLRAADAANAEIQLKQLDIEEKNLYLAQAQETQNLELKQLEGQLDKLQKELGTNTLKAPCNGTIVYVAGNVAEGRGVSAFDPILYITDDSKLYISCEEIGSSVIDNADSVYAKIDDGEYEITSLPYDQKEYVTLLLAGGKPQSRFSIDNIDDSVQAGDYVVVVVTAMTNKDTLVIPSNALYKDDMGHFVYKIVDGRRERCNVEIGEASNLATQIVKGLEEGDVVYVQE